MSGFVFVRLYLSFVSLKDRIYYYSKFLPEINQQQTAQV